jgi:uncharacterized protein (DUF924 family)
LAFLLVALAALHLGADGSPTHSIGPAPLVYDPGRMDPRLDALLQYWFGPRSPDLTLAQLRESTKLWFYKNPETDRRILADFGADVERAARGELDAWADTPQGRLGLVVLLDQFPRNIHRNLPLAYAQDAKALPLVLDGVAQKVDALLTVPERFVFQLPLMHAEDREVQTLSVSLYRKLLDEGPAELRPELQSAFDFSERHRAVVERFGRFPHRNTVLGRPSTAEELEFLKEPHSAF